MLNIFTLSWNGSDKLDKLKKSLMPALQSIDYTWFIKDNGSVDNTKETITSWENNKVIADYYKDNLQNFSEGMNHLYNLSKPKSEDYVLLLNNDVVFNDTKSITNMINLLKSRQEVGIVGAQLLYSKDKIQHAGVVFSKHVKLPFHFRANEKPDKHSQKNREFQAVTGAVMLLRASDYPLLCTNKSGNKGLCEDFIWAFDDIDMCLSMKYNLNKKIVYCGNTNIFHEESASLKKNPVNKLFMQHNVSTFHTKWSGRYLLDQDNYFNNKSFNLYK